MDGRGRSLTGPIGEGSRVCSSVRNRLVEEKRVVNESGEEDI